MDPTPTQTLKQHLLDFFKGFVGALLAALALAAANYLGAHLPDLLNLSGILAAGVVGVKTGK